MQFLTIKGQENGIVIISELNVGLKGLDNDSPSENKGQINSTIRKALYALEIILAEAFPQEPSWQQFVVVAAAS